MKISPYFAVDIVIFKKNSFFRDFATVEILSFLEDVGNKNFQGRLRRGTQMASGANRKFFNVFNEND